MSNRRENWPPKKSGIGLGLGLNVGGGGWGPWSAPNWTDTAGVWRPNPATGSELVLNGSMESPAVPGPPDSWDAMTATLTSVADERTGGSGAISMEVEGIANYGRARQDLSALVAAGEHIVVSGYCKAGTSTVSLRIITAAFGNSRVFGSDATGNWTLIGPATHRWRSTDKYIMCWNSNSGALTGRYDDISVKKLTQSNLFAIRNYYSQKPVYGELSIGAGFQAAVVTRYSDINNYLIALHDGTNAKLITVIAGAWTELVSSAEAYAEWRSIEIRFPAANMARLYYNGSAVGGEQDVSGVPAGTYAGMYGTNILVGVRAFAIS